MALQGDSITRFIELKITLEYIELAVTRTFQIPPTFKLIACT